MNMIPMSGYFRWLSAFAVLGLCGTFFLWSELIWTPIQRYYFGTYLRCSWPGIDHASLSEIRWIYKTGPDGKQELASDDDVIPASSEATRQIPMHLSSGARQSGWIGLTQAPEERFPIAKLQPLLEAQFYDGESVWMMLLLPFLCGIALLCFLFAGLGWLESWIDYAPWRVERLPWEEPALSSLQKWTIKIGRIRSSLSEFAKERPRKVAAKATPAASSVAPVESPKKPSQALPLFGASDGTRKEGFTWDRTKEID